MQFTFHTESGSDCIYITDDIYKYLFKARRHKLDDEIFFRNLVDDFIYKYIVKNINKKEALLHLDSKVEKIVKAEKNLHVAWCVIDTKIIEKYITALNEIGVSHITFVYSSFSQKNFKPNLDKLNKILINSSQQCGRSSMMQLDFCNSLNEFLEKYPNTKILDFSQNKISNDTKVDTILIGTEGGFSSAERELFKKENILGLDSNLILRSETAAISVASKILL